MSGLSLRRSRSLRLSLLVLAAGHALAAPSALAGLRERADITPRPTAGAFGVDESAIPVRKITLYRSGVGFFERHGDITGDASIELRFKTGDINDIIKSMVLIDKGGRVESVSYGSKEPMNRRLASFGVDIADNPSVPNLLNRLRGASIRVTAGGEVISGTIMGIEQRRTAGGKDQAAFDAPFLNLLTPGGVRSIAVNDISSFELLDKDLAGELTKALAAVAEYRADRTKSVQIRFAGAGVSGPRPVTVGYIHEMPVWKTSYRLVLPEETGRMIQPGDGGAVKGGDAGGNGAAPGKTGNSMNLQGWAIVENNTDEDWNDVRLALVSGQPVSFQMDLYEPLYVERPFIPVPTIPGVSPRAYSGGTDQALHLALQDAAAAPLPASRPMSSLGRVLSRAEVAEKDDKAPLEQRQDMLGRGKSYGGLGAADLADYAASARAAGSEVGEVFQYELDSPVSIERQRSAMIPILNTAVTGTRVSIFNLSDGSEHPMRGVELTNSSTLQLLPGPLSVFDTDSGRSAYAGDAVIGHVAPGEKRFLAYAVDLDVDVQTKQENTSNILRLRIVQGAIEQTIKSVTTQTYAFKNKDQSRPRSIVIEHVKVDPAWQLVNPKAPDEQTQTHYRFRLTVDPGKTVALPVVGERVDRQSVGILNYDTETMVRFERNGQLSLAVLDVFRQVAQKQADLQAIERSIGEIDRQTQEINADQGRIRENMARIDSGSQLYARYMSKLTEQETTLEDLVQQRRTQQQRLEDGRTAFNEFVRGLNVE
ncbi:MAG: hypothetical protein AB7G11_16540 [Phycisphaerales bacterium]